MVENSIEKDDGNLIMDLPQNVHRTGKTEKETLAKRIRTGSLVLFLAGIVALTGYCSLATGKAVDTSPDAQEAISSRVSTVLAAGTKILEKDDNYIGGDLTITHSDTSDETTLYIWDYAAEDGDYVQVLVNGEAIGEPFMIKNKPATYTVPSVGEIQVIGTRDGGGGITYAVYYTLNNTTYFNGMNEGGSNTYTLIRETT